MKNARNHKPRERHLASWDEGMKPMNTHTEALPERQASVQQRRAVRIMAKALFQEFQRNGFSESHVIDFTSDLLELLTESLRTPVVTSTRSSALVPSLEVIT
jgi:hypothetical protein